jgi:DNA-binding MurR/RpiR family transcriptional regulator
MIDWNTLFINGPRRLTPAQKKVVQYIFNNTEEVVYLNSSKLGAANGVSNATIVRLAQELGFRGYPELQQYLRERIKAQLNSADRLARVPSNIESVGDLVNSVMHSDQSNLQMVINSVNTKTIESIIKEIQNREQVFILGLRSSHCLAHFLATNLRYLGKQTHLIKPGSGSLWSKVSTVTQGALLISFTFPRYVRLTCEVTDFFKKGGATVVAFTDSAMSPLSEYADYLITCPFLIDSYFESFTATMSVLNTILAGLAYTEGEKSYKMLKSIEKIWNEKRIYYDSHKRTKPSWAHRKKQ